MNQQPLVNSKTLVEMAQKLKTPSAGHLTATDRAKVKQWRDAVLKRMREINQLVPETDPAFHEGLSGEDITRIWPSRLAYDDPKRKEVIAEYEELQRKYRKCADILTGSAKLEEVG